MMALFPMMSERHIPLSERQYYPNEDDLHGVHAPGTQWHPFTTTTRSTNTVPNSTGFLSSADSFLTSPFYWNANVWSNVGAGSTPGWNHHAEEASFRTISHNNNLTAHSDSRFTSSHDYPESSQRTALPTTPPVAARTTYSSSPSSSNSPPYHHEYSRSSSCGTSDFNDSAPCHWGGGAALYTIDEPETDLEPTLSHPTAHTVSSPGSSHPTSSSISQRSSTPVKVEPDETDDCFIMELPTMPDAAIISQSLAPPTEVPLRATQASEEMRGMMTVFRINPFAMHSAGRGAVPMAPFNSGDAGPLEEEPLVFEFQLELDDVASEESEEEPYEDGGGGDRNDGGALVFGVDVGEEEDGDGGGGGEVGVVDTGECQWGKYGGTSPAMFETSQIQASSWDLECPPSCLEEYSLPSSASMTPELPIRRSARLHNTSSHPYSRNKSTYLDREDVMSTSGSHFATSRNQSVEMNRMRLRRPPSEPSPPPWESCGVYVPSSANARYYVDSSEYQCEVGRSSMSAISRRWSVPGGNAHASFVM